MHQWEVNWGKRPNFNWNQLLLWLMVWMLPKNAKLATSNTWQQWGELGVMRGVMMMLIIQALTTVAAVQGPKSVLDNQHWGLRHPRMITTPGMEWMHPDLLPPVLTLWVPAALVMQGWWLSALQNGLLIPRNPFSWRPPTRRHSSPKLTSHPAYCSLLNM
jgi:hypothetical protein